MPTDNPKATISDSQESKTGEVTAAAAHGAGGLASELLAGKTRRNSAVLVGTLLLIGLGLWTYFGVKNSLRDMRAASMQTVLDAEVNALRGWIEEKKSDVKTWANDERVKKYVQQLVAASRGGGKQFCNSPASAALRGIMEPVLKEEGSLSFNVIDPTGLIVATRFREYCGLRVKTGTFLAHATEVFKGRTKFVHPHIDQQRVNDAPVIIFKQPVVWVEAPVRDARGIIIAALGFAKSADEQFSTLLSAARPGKSGEVYAFDEKGVMLSESRFLGELQQIGLVPREPRATAMLRVQLRDPGGDLATGYQPELELAARPYTQLAALAIASRDKDEEGLQRGVILDPYRNYRGIEVVGAWKWLPEYDMGVAVEISAEEAYAPLRYLNITFALIFGMLILSAAAALLSSFSLLRLRRQLGETRRVGQYYLERQIGEGGMSTVYLAKHALLKRPAAVKVLKHHLGGDEFIARFEREVQLASQLGHPNTVEIYDYGHARDGVFYYAMEYLTGINLAELVSIEGKVGTPRTVHILRQVCAALRAAHEKGLVHRDIKPENIMLCQRGGEHDVVKLLDFGLVKDVDSPTTRDITRFTKVLGTPVYMAPERIRNPGDVDARADIYAVGAVAFYLLTGRKLFEGARDSELTQLILHAVPPRPSEFQPRIPAVLDNLIVRCLAKDRAERPQNIAELLAVIEPLVNEQRWTQLDAAEWWRGDWNFIRKSISQDAEFSQ